MAVPQQINEDRLNELLGKVVGDLGATMSAPLMVIGDRLGLVPGTYVLTIEGEAVPSSLPPPQLLSSLEGAAPRVDPLGLADGKLTRTFTASGGRDTTLRLRGGGPFIIKGIRVEAGSTFPAAPGLIP